MPLTLVDNPLMRHKLGSLRNIETPSDSFRRIMEQISIQLFYEAAQDLPTSELEIEAPFAKTTIERIAKPISLIPVMRAGIGMAESILNLWPDAAVGHIGIYRDKFIKNTVEYYFKMPKDVTQSAVFLLDPIIATGDTAIASIDRVKEIGCTDIRFLSILMSKQAKLALQESHPDIHIIAVAVDDDLNDEGYLTPGIGDVGARYYNTL